MRVQDVSERAKLLLQCSVVVIRCKVRNADLYGSDVRVFQLYVNAVMWGVAYGVDAVVVSWVYDYP